MQRLLVLALVLTSATAWAQWEKIYDAQTFTVYVDPTFEKAGDNLGYTSILVDLKKPGRNGTLSMRQLFEIDCKEEQVQLHFTSSFSGRMGGGPLILIRSYQKPDWISAVPDTYFGAVMARACRSSTVPVFL